MMTVSEIVLSGGGLLFVLLTVVQIAPLQINPWSAIARAIGKAINKDVLDKLDEVKKDQKQTSEALDNHIRIDDKRNADAHRMRILQFNNELLRDILHTREDFIEILEEIDFYERFCEEHPDYENNRCVHAIANICRVYDDRLVKHDFL